MGTSLAISFTVALVGAVIGGHTCHELEPLLQGVPLLGGQHHLAAGLGGSATGMFKSSLVSSRTAVAPPPLLLLPSEHHPVPLGGELLHSSDSQLLLGGLHRQPKGGRSRLYGAYVGGFGGYAARHPADLGHALNLAASQAVASHSRPTAVDGLASGWQRALPLDSHFSSDLAAAPTLAGFDSSAVVPHSYDESSAPLRLGVDYKSRSSSRRRAAKA